MRRWDGTTIYGVVVLILTFTFIAAMGFQHYEMRESYDFEEDEFEEIKEEMEEKLEKPKIERKPPVIPPVKKADPRHYKVEMIDGEPYAIHSVYTFGSVASGYKNELGDYRLQMGEVRRKASYSNWDGTEFIVNGTEVAFSTNDFANRIVGSFILTASGERIEIPNGENGHAYARFSPDDLGVGLHYVCYSFDGPLESYEKQVGVCKKFENTGEPIIVTPYEQHGIGGANLVITENGLYFEHDQQRYPMSVWNIAISTPQYSPGKEYLTVTGSHHEGSTDYLYDVESKELMNDRLGYYKLWKDNGDSYRLYTCDLGPYSNSDFRYLDLSKDGELIGEKIVTQKVNEGNFVYCDIRDDIVRLVTLKGEDREPIYSRYDTKTDTEVDITSVDLQHFHHHSPHELHVDLDEIDAAQ